MKNKIVMACLLPLTLAACFGSNDRPVLTKTEYKLVEIDDKYFECEQVKLPNPETLTNIEIANLINDLVKANRLCGNNMKAIKLYQEAAKQIIEERKN